jgi:anti-sigma regulatory factor (Ser/Thr protein kinase)
VKPFLSKIFSRAGQENLVDSPAVQFPPPIAIDTPFEAQKRSMIGVVARKIAIQNNADRHIQDALIYLPFSIETFIENKADETEYILFLSEGMVRWIQEKEDVYSRIREMGVQGKYHECFLNVYEEVKEDIYSCVHPRDESAPLSEQEEVWKVYRDVMFAVTQRKFLLIQQAELSKYKEGNILCEYTIQERSDIPKARDGAKVSLLESGINQTKVMSFILIISEAITNILKHAEAGKMTIVQRDREIYVIVEDRGPGFNLKLLPNMTLMAGYSTKKSLGQGFTLMMKIAKQVLLATNSEGSTIVLIFEKKEGDGNEGKSLA